MSLSHRGEQQLWCDSSTFVISFLHLVVDKVHCRPLQAEEKTRRLISAGGTDHQRNTQHLALKQAAKQRRLHWFPPLCSPQPSVHHASRCSHATQRLDNVSIVPSFLLLPFYLSLLLSSFCLVLPVFIQTWQPRTESAAGGALFAVIAVSLTFYQPICR